MHQSPNRIAAFVLERLPDSIQERKQILADLLQIVGEQHTLYGAVATKLSLLEISEDQTLQLALQFRAQ